MTHDEILGGLTEIFRSIFDDESLVASEEMTADDVADWDSVSNITLVVAVERQFNVKFKTAEIESLKNVGDLVALIAAKTGS